MLLLGKNEVLRVSKKELQEYGNIITFTFSFAQCFDLEGESGIVVRGIGTCVVLASTSHSIPTSPSQYIHHTESSSAINIGGDK